MNIKIRTRKALKVHRFAAGWATAILLGGVAASAQAQITSTNWGTVTAPVYGQLDTYPSGLPAFPARNCWPARTSSARAITTVFCQWQDRHPRRPEHSDRHEPFECRADARRQISGYHQ